MTARRSCIAAVLLLVGILGGCSHVQVFRLTSETFPPHAVDDVEILSHEPSRAHLKIADLSETSSSDDFETLQAHILKKAAELGADAVVFSSPVSHSEERIAYEQSYSPWGLYAPYYYGPGPYGYWGPWGYRYAPWGPGWGYRQAVPVRYRVRVITLKGTAVKYT